MSVEVVMASYSEEKHAFANHSLTPLISTRKWQLAEVLVFLFLIVPSMALSFLVHNQPTQVSFVLLAVMIMLRDLSLAALIFYFLWRNNEPLFKIGWRMDQVGREVVLGVLLFPLYFVVTLGVDWVFVRLGLSPAPQGSAEFLKPHGGAQYVLASVLVLVVAGTEETIFRGYLLLRFTSVSQSIGVAVILSSLIFSIGHGYEGTSGVATVGVMGIIFALIYLWRGSLVAPATLHFLQDFLVMVVLSGAMSTGVSPPPSPAILQNRGRSNSQELGQLPNAVPQTTTVTIYKSDHALPLDGRKWPASATPWQHPGFLGLFLQPLDFNSQEVAQCLNNAAVKFSGGIKVRIRES